MIVALAVGAVIGMQLDARTGKEANEALSALAAHYQTCSSVEVRVHATDMSTGTPFRSAGRHVVLSDGRLASWHWIGFSTPLQGVWSIPASTFKFRDSKSLIVPHTAQTYMKLSPEDTGGKLPDDLLAYAIAPWPRLGAWCGTLDAADDLSFSHQGRVFTASSTEVGLSLRWEDTCKLLSVRVGSASDGREYEFEGSASGPFFPPTRVTEQITAGAKKRPGVVWTYESVQFNLDNDEAAVSPDATTQRFDRYDVATGDVFRPSGDFRYNEPELLKALAVKESWGPAWARVVWGAVVVSVTASLYSWWRRWRVATCVNAS